MEAPTNSGRLIEAHPPRILGRFAFSVQGCIACAKDPHSHERLIMTQLSSHASSAPVPSSNDDLRQPSSPIHPIIQLFHRGYLDRKDPFESAGVQLMDISSSSSFYIQEASTSEVEREIQESLYREFESWRSPCVRVQIVDHDDATIEDEPPRRFLVASLATTRDTQATVTFYTASYGQMLYYSIRSYVVPPLSVSKVIGASLVALPILPFLALSIIALFAGASVLSLLQAFVTLALVALVISRKFVRNIRYGDSVHLALRKEFPSPGKLPTFDHDDVELFFKSHITFILTTISTVLERHGVDIAPIKHTVQNITTTTIDNRGGSLSIIDAVIGGIDNKLTGK